jgi:hypothetical protein
MDVGTELGELPVGSDQLLVEEGRVGAGVAEAFDSRNSRESLQELPKAHGAGR